MKKVSGQLESTEKQKGYAEKSRKQLMDSTLAPQGEGKPDPQKVKANLVTVEWQTSPQNRPAFLVSTKSSVGI
jgi:hypothetical protein